MSSTHNAPKGEDEALARLEAIVARHRTQVAAAEVLGISQPYLSDMLNRRCNLPDYILDQLGMAREVVVKGDPKVK